MKNNFVLETGLVIGVLVALFLLVNPWNWFMSDMLGMTLACVAALLFLCFISFVFAESVHDEREELHRYLASRLGYFGGVSVLMIIIVLEKVFLHMADTGLILALGVMLLMKVVGTIYARYRF